MASWRLAKSLETLRSQINTKWPKRSKTSDGTKGDDRHAATKSDHNPNKAGVVQALDITNDPKSGCVSQEIADALVASRDPRIKYVISNKRICSGDAGPLPWKWRKYTGANAHDKHVHISVKDDKVLYDNTAEWAAIDAKPVVKAQKAIVTARSVGTVAGTVAAGAQIAAEAIGPVGSTVTQVREVTDNAGQVVATVKEVVDYAPDGIFQKVVAYMQTPRFLLAALVFVLVAWGATYAIRRWGNR